MQFRYLVFGLLIAAIFVGFSWVNSLPGIAPVRLPAEQLRAQELAAAKARRAAEDAENGSEENRFQLDEDGSAEQRDNDAAAAILPELNDSDDWLRDQLIQTASPWLAETELLRTAATVLENASRGELPRKFLAFLAPEGPYQVNKMGSLIQVNPASYDRYTPFVKNLQRLTPERAAELFRTVEPLLAESVRELGRNDVTPRELAYIALGIALDTPRVDSASSLKQPKVIYTYADASLEELKPLQKQLLRMGPENLQSVRLWLEDFGLALSPSSLFGEDEVDDKGTQASDFLRNP